METTRQILEINGQLREPDITEAKKRKLLLLQKQLLKKRLMRSRLLNNSLQNR